ncbi:MAG: flagellar biosynthesis anti-sigma factor FlgM [Defluviitaleaceae bacterium]|nr:flagellar biosynthesis anti-sigma factor FlgM [Defluviitaleaceae bacterium]
MKITGIGNVQGVVRPTEVKPNVRADKARSFADVYESTALASEFNLARKAIVVTPDIREDKVEDVMARMAAGDYNFSAADLAQRIMTQS